MDRRKQRWENEQREGREGRVRADCTVIIRSSRPICRVS